jgi:hypothetical protein
MAAKVSYNIQKYFLWILFPYGHSAAKCSCKWSPWKIARYLQSTNYFASQNPGLHSIVALILNWPPVAEKQTCCSRLLPLKCLPNFTLQAKDGPWPLLMQTTEQVYQQQSEIRVVLWSVLTSNPVALLNPQIQTPVHLHTCTFGFQIDVLQKLL